MRNPFRGRPDLIPALIGSIAFAGIPLALLADGVKLDWIAWLSMVFGLVGLIAVGAQLMGYQPRQRPVKSRPRRSAPSSKPVHRKGPLPELSAGKQAQLRRVVRAMADAGVFAPQTPDPAMLYAGAAEMGWSIQPDVVLFALMEADYYHPGFDSAPCLANIVLHDMQVETPAERIEAMIRDLERLSAGALAIADLAVTQDIVDPAARTVRTTASMTINGELLHFAEEHPFKYFPLGLHPAIAAHLPPHIRFATLWVDQGAFVTALAPGAVEAMNAKLRLTENSRCIWDWIEPAPSGAA